MYGLDATLKVSVGRKILVVTAWGTIVDETQPVPVGEVHIQQALIGTVKTDASIGQGGQGIVVAHIGIEDHHATVETIGPAYIRHGGEGGVHCQQLIRCFQDDHISIEIDDSFVLGQFPQFDLGEGRDQIGSVHEVEVRRGRIGDPTHGDNFIVDFLVRRQLQSNSVLCMFGWSPT